MHIEAFEASYELTTPASVGCWLAAKLTLRASSGSHIRLGLVLMHAWRGHLSFLWIRSLDPILVNYSISCVALAPRCCVLTSDRASGSAQAAA
jgi:hypothetical protein